MHPATEYTRGSVSTYMYMYITISVLTCKMLGVHNLIPISSNIFNDMCVREFYFSPYVYLLMHTYTCKVRSHFIITHHCTLYNLQLWRSNVFFAMYFWTLVTSMCACTTCASPVFSCFRCVRVFVRIDRRAGGFERRNTTASSRLVFSLCT